MNEKKTYCPACGAELDAEGICTREKCPRRALQLKQKAAREAAEKANESIKTLRREGSHDRI